MGLIPKIFVFETWMRYIMLLFCFFLPFQGFKKKKKENNSPKDVSKNRTYNIANIDKHINRYTT
jgi:hypothetical protein